MGMSMSRRRSRRRSDDSSSDDDSNRSKMDCNKPKVCCKMPRLIGTPRQIIITRGPCGELIFSTPQNLDILSSPTFAGETITGTLTAGNLIVNGTTTFTGPTTLFGPLAVNGNESVTGDITAGGELIASSLEITGPTTLVGPVNVTGNITATGTVTGSNVAVGSRAAEYTTVTLTVPTPVAPSNLTGYTASTPVVNQSGSGVTLIGTGNPVGAGGSGYSGMTYGTVWSLDPGTYTVDYETSLSGAADLVLYTGTAFGPAFAAGGVMTADTNSLAGSTTGTTWIHGRHTLVVPISLGVFYVMLGGTTGTPTPATAGSNVNYVVRVNFLKIS